MGKSKIVEWEKIVLPIPYDLKSVNSYIIEESPVKTETLPNEF